MQCPSCQSPNADAAVRCAQCRAPLRDPRAYTPRHLAERILTSRSALEGERKQVTVLFADVKGSTELAEQLDPEEWHELLDRFFQILTGAVHRFEGTVNQYTGDGIMALFGAPLAHEDHARRACHAALHARRALRAYADELRTSQDLDFAVRLGLNSGDVVVGKIGSDLRMDYTAQGHCVAIAARLQQRAEPGAILLSAATARLVDGYFELGPPAELALAGARDPVGVRELRGPGELRTRLDASRARGFSAFVGRQTELAVLTGALADARRGEGRVVEVVGDAGMGKSRLCYEFAEACRARGLPVYEAHASSHGQDMPLVPVLELLRGALEIGDADPEPRIRKALSARLGRRADARARALILDLLGVPQALPAADPDEHRQRVAQAVARVLSAGPAPAVILVEDLQWLDGPSQALLEELVAGAAGAPRLVLVNFRPEHAPAWGEPDHGRRVALAPLGDDAVRALLADLLGPHTSAAGLYAPILARTRGNPFFVEEVVQMLVDEQALAGQRGAYRLVRAVDDLAVPASVRDVLASRIDRLGEAQKLVLQLAAVVGDPIPVDLLRAVSGLAEAELAPALARLVAAEFLHSVDAREYAFRHPLTQAVAYQTQLRGRRARTHAAVAAALEQAAAGTQEEQAARLAHHWEAAGEWLEAARCHTRAAEWIGLTDPAEALRHWRRVRKLAARLDTAAADAQRGEACFQTLNLGWRLGLSDADLRSAVSEGQACGARDPALIVRVLCAYALCQILRGAVRPNLAPLSEALELARLERSDAMEIDVSLSLGDVAWRVGELARAEALCTRVAELTRADPSPRGFSGSSAYLDGLARRAAIRAERGAHGDARDDAERALELAEANGLDENLLVGLMMAVHVDELSGDARSALARSRRMARLALRSGSPLRTLEASLYAGIAHALHGRFDDATAQLAHVVERIDERGLARHHLGRALTARAVAELGAGRAADAEATARRAVRSCRSAGLHTQECAARLSLARAQWAREGAAARRKLRAGLAKVEALIAETGADAYAPQVVELRARLGRSADAVQRGLAQARERYREQGAHGQSARLARELAGTGA